MRQKPSQRVSRKVKKPAVIQLLNLLQRKTMAASYAVAAERRIAHLATMVISPSMNQDNIWAMVPQPEKLRKNVWYAKAVEK